MAVAEIQTMETQKRRHAGHANARLDIANAWEELSMDQYQGRGKLLKNFQDHWSIRISPGERMDQWLVHMNFPRDWYGPMALEVL